MAGTNSIYPRLNLGKRLVPDLQQSLPYEQARVVLDCYHSPFYVTRFDEEQPWFCGLCFFRAGVEAEVPTRIHQYRVLASNGNPETTGKMVAHLHMIMGLKPPRNGESLKEFRKHRISLARVQFTARSPLKDHKVFIETRLEPFSKAAPGLFPITSSLWKLMGYQPPLAKVLIEGVNGRTEIEIAQRFDVSVLDIYSRMAKAIRTGMGFIPNGDTERTRSSSHQRRTGGSEEVRPD